MQTTMKRILHFAALLTLLLAAPLARAWVYKDGDVLLIFRENGSDDVEFDLGNISQFLNKTNGYTTTVGGWDANPVLNTFGSDLTGVSVIVLATTSNTSSSLGSWVSGPEPDTTAYRISPTAWQSTLYATINSLGTRPVIYAVPTVVSLSYPLSPGGALPSPDTNAYVFDPGNVYQIDSYDWIVSGGVSLGNAIYPNTAYLPSLGGNSAFIVESIIPTTFDFWEIQPSTTSPAPADTYVGQFNIATNGTLTFVAGPPQSTIQGITRAGNVSDVQFSTVVGVQYALVSTNNLDVPVSQWPVVSGPIQGNGFNNSLTDTNSAATRFYQIRSP
jgi:hypothetical protein